MNNEELTQLATKAFEAYPKIKVFAVYDVNHRPHAFTIGPKAVAEAHDNHSGMLTEEVVNKVGCEFPGGCDLSYEEHTHDTVCFLEFLEDISEAELNEALQAATPSLEKYTDGYGFVKGAGKIIEDEQTGDNGGDPSAEEESQGKPENSGNLDESTTDS